MTRFRPCIDLHAGVVKQIVGGTLSSSTTNEPSSSSSANSLKTNHVSPHSAAHFARLYRENGLEGGHVIMLGPGNTDAASEAVKAWPGGLQVGGGIGGGDQAGEWIRKGAGKVILTSYLFPNGKFSQQRLDEVLQSLGGDTNKLVIDLSCRRVHLEDGGVKWFVAMDKWQRITDMEVCQESLNLLRPYCSEFLIHAADHEGLQRGIDEQLVRNLGLWSRELTSLSSRSSPPASTPLSTSSLTSASASASSSTNPGLSTPNQTSVLGNRNKTNVKITYAGGATSLDDLDRVKELSGGNVDLTIGSALDCFGGKGVRFLDCVLWNQRQE